MTKTETLSQQPDIISAQEFFSPKKFQFHPIFDNGNLIGYSKEFNNRAFHFFKLNRHDLHVPQGAEVSPLAVVAEAQKFSFETQNDKEILPAHTLASLEDAGGSVLIVPDNNDEPISYNNWLGFLIALPSNNKIARFKSMGVNPKARNAKLGFNLVLLQACIAAEDGYTSATWTTNPMMGANVNLFNNLGATIEEYSQKFYGETIYSNSVTDRFKLNWDFLSASVRQKILQEQHNEPNRLSLTDVSNIPVIYAEEDSFLLTDVWRTSEKKTPRTSINYPILYEAPGDIQQLTGAQKETWLEEMRTVFGSFIDYEKYIDTSGGRGVLEKTTGTHRITNFITGRDITGQRKNYFLLEQKR